MDPLLREHRNRRLRWLIQIVIERLFAKEPPMLTPDQEQQFRDHLRAVNARETCPACDAGRWTIDVSGELRLLMRRCACCGHILLFDPKPLGWYVSFHLAVDDAGYFALRPIVRQRTTVCAVDIQAETIRTIRFDNPFPDSIVIQPLADESSPPSPTNQNT